MVVITISYPHQPRYNYSPLSPSTSVSPTLTDSGSEQLPSLLQVSSDGDTVAATKQEEWIKKKKVELTTTKQIETRVKRQIVLEDGKVVDDSGPIVTTNTTEDTDKKESEHTEHLTHGDDMEGKEGWVVVEALPDEAVVKETNERKVTTHDEVEDILETEEVQHYGDASNEEILRAIREGATARKSLLGPSDKKELLPFSGGKDAVQKRVLQQSRRHDRTTDIEDTKEVSKVKEDGNVVTEITRRHEHEVFHNEDIPDSDSDEFEQIENREGVHDYSHGKSENFIEYVAIPKGASPSQGVKIGDGGHFISENISTHRDGDEDLWDSVSERIRRLPKTDPLFAQQNINQPPNAQPSRPDALTQRPLDLDQEEYTRKNETNRWLNSHFGSSSSSLNSSEASPRLKSPLNTSTTPPTGIHVTMTSRGSPLQQYHSSPPPPPPPIIPGAGGGGGGGGSILLQRTNQNIHHHNQRTLPSTAKSQRSKTEKEPVGKRISFGDSPTSPHRHPNPRQNHSQNSVHFDLRNRHYPAEDVIRSLNSQMGRVSVTKSGSPWDDVEPTPTPPPRSRRRNNSPEYFRSYADNHHTSSRHPHQAGTMMNSNNFSSRHYTSDSPTYLQRSEDVGERKAYERREQSFGYNGPNTTGGLSRDHLDSGNFNSGYVTKHSNQYKMNENSNPGQNAYYENGEAEVTQKKTVERREKVFSYDGASQKQFHPKYIVGTPSSTMNRLKGIEHTGAVIENNNHVQNHNHDRSQTLPRRRFYFGDDEGSLLGKDKRSQGKSLRFGGSDDINVSISNSYENGQSETLNRKANTLSRSMSFNPRSNTGGGNNGNGVGRPSPTYHQQPPPRLSSENKYSPTYKSNPQLLDAPDLLTPKLIQNISRSVRDVSSVSNNDYYYNNRNHQYTNHHNNYHHHSNNNLNHHQYDSNNSVNHATTTTTKTKRGLFDSLKKNSVDLFDSVRGSKASSPSRSMTPTHAYNPVSSPLRNGSLISNPRASLQSPRHFGGGNSPLSDDYHETYRMSSSTPDQDETKPKIKTDTTSKFSKRTIRTDDGRPIGNVESSETTTRTQSRYKESEVMYPNNGHHQPHHRTGIHSPLGYHSPPPPTQHISSGTVVIPVRDPNNNKNSHYGK